MSGAPLGTLGSYRLLEEVPCPSGGRAFQAVDPSSSTPILLHLLPEDVSQDLLRETRLLNRLHRPGIPVLYEVGTVPEGTFVAFAPPPGKTLAAFVIGGGRVDRATLGDWIAQTLGLLAEAHAEGILHRNLSPETIVLADDQTLGLAGFSLTNLAAQARELQSPEQQAGEELSPTSDLFSLAALFQRLSAPADLGGAASVSLAQDDPLVAVLNRATHPDPSKRFHNAAEMEMVVRRASEPRQIQVPIQAVPVQEGPVQEGPVQEGPAQEVSVQEAPAQEVPIQDAAFQTMAMQGSALQELLAQHAPGAQPTDEPQEPSPVSAPPAPRSKVPIPESTVHSPFPPPQEATEPGPPKRRSGPLVVAAILGLITLFGALALWQSRQMNAEREARRLAASTAPEQVSNSDSDPATGEALGDEQDPALRLARILLQDGDALFGAVELTEDDRQLVEEMRTDIAEVSFEDDPRGDETARSLFGENPLLAKNNPLLTERMRERWLGDAIHNIGSDHAMEHLQEETERLRRGEVSRAEWYAHVAKCKDFCNRVVSGLLYEHVQQVRRQPNYLVLFPSSGATLTTEHRAALDGFLAAQQGTTHLLLIGRSSRGGNRDYNRELSNQRVIAVQEVAEGLGVEEDRINAFWLGFEPPRLTPELARVYGLKADVPLEELNQSVLVVAYRPGGLEGA